MSRSLRSPIWTFFTVVDGIKYVAKCNMCKHNLSYKTSTSNLRKHLKTKHPTFSLVDATPFTFLGRDQDEEILDDPAPRQQQSSTSAKLARFKRPSTTTSNVEQELAVSIPGTSSEVREVTEPNRATVVSSEDTPQSSGCRPKQPVKAVQQKLGAFVPKRLGTNQKSQIDKALLKLFTRDFQPFSIVEDEGFVEYTRALNPSYTIPGRKTISKSWIPAKFSECLHDTKIKINSAESICLTFDTWTSVNTDNFLGVTAHFVDDNFELQSALLQCAQFPGSHTAQNIAESLREIVKVWDIHDKVVLAVTDNADNVVNAVKVELNWKHLGCFAHSLNLAVRKALNCNTAIVALIEDVKRIVSHFKRSTQSTEKLIEYQLKNNDPKNKPKKLIQDVSTKWNSTFFMIQRCVPLDESIKATVALINKDLPLLTSKQWKILAELVLVLRPFYDVTKNISGEKYATASLVIPMANSLFAVCERLQSRNFSPEVQNVILEMKKGIISRFRDFENSHTLSMVTLLDPRFKNLVFNDLGAADRAKERLVNAVAKFHLDDQRNVSVVEDDDQATGDQGSETAANKELSVFYNLDTYLSNKKKKGTNKSRAIVEVDRFLEDDELERKADPLIWWREKGLQYPNIRKMAKRYFGCLATSVPCERAFSKAGLIVSDRRNRLSGEQTKMLMFLNGNEPSSRQKSHLCQRGKLQEENEGQEDKFLNEIITKLLESS